MSDKDASFLTHIDMSESEGVEKDPDEMELQMDAILKDPRRKAALLRKMVLEDSRSSDPEEREEAAGQRQEETTARQHLTPSGMATDAWQRPPAPAPSWPGFCPPFPPFMGYSPWAGGRGMDGQWGAHPGILGVRGLQVQV